MPAAARTKKDLLRQLSRGLAYVHAVSTATKFHVAVPGDPDPDGGIWIYISMDRGFRAETVLAAHARLAGRSMRLTRAEAAQVARYIARAIGRREAPWHSGVLHDNAKQERRTQKRSSG